MNFQEKKTFYYAAFSAIVTALNFLATIATLVSFQSGYLSGETPNFWYLVILIVFFGILYLVLFSVQFFWVSPQQNFILALAKHGHLQTLRMYILLQGISQKRQHRRFAWLAEKIDRTEYIAKAAFHFTVKNNPDAAPDIVYRYEFTITVGQPGNILFEPLIFGDNNAKPENCEIELQYFGTDSGKQHYEIQPVTSPEVHSIEDNGIVAVDWYSDNAENRGIYYIRSALLFQKRGTYRIVLTYTRKKAFMIDDAEMFVIFPAALFDSLDRKIVEASFDITFCDFPEDRYEIADTAVLTEGKDTTSEYIHVLLQKVENGETEQNPGKSPAKETPITKMQSSTVKIDSKNVYILVGKGKHMIRRKANRVNGEEMQAYTDQETGGAVLATV